MLIRKYGAQSRSTNLYKVKLHICLYSLHHISIWSLTFQFRVNLVPAIISWMEITDVANGQNKKISSH